MMGRRLAFASPSPYRLKFTKHPMTLRVLRERLVTSLLPPMHNYIRARLFLNQSGTTPARCSHRSPQHTRSFHTAPENRILSFYFDFGIGSGTPYDRSVTIIRCSNLQYKTFLPDVLTNDHTMGGVGTGQYAVD